MAIPTIAIGQVLLRDFEEADRAAFTQYQAEPDYRHLYDFDEDLGRSNRLFDLFLAWQRETPRRNYQLAIVDRQSNQLLGCGGLRRAGEHAAVLGIELAPREWGRYRRAIDAVLGLLSYGFDTLGLGEIIGDTASGNRRVEKLAEWFGAEVVACREGPEWMRLRGWCEVDWSLSKANWSETKQRLQAKIL